MPTRESRLDVLNGYLQVKFYELNQTIEVRKAQGLEAARAIVLNDTGQAAMESIRAKVNDMLVAEHTLLDQRLLAYRAAERQTFLITGGLFAVLLLLSVGGGYGLIRNFAKLTRTENELEIKARLLQATLDTVREGIGAFDGSGAMVASNQRFFELLDLPVSAASAGITLGELLRLNQDPDGPFAAAADLVSRGGEFAQVSGDPKDGRFIDIYRNAMQGGGAVLTVRDVTENRQAENALRQAQKMETVGQLTGGVAHDFNNLLQIMMANLDLALRRTDDPATEKRLRDALKAAERGSKLTGQLLAFARRQPLRPEPLDMTRMIRELAELLRRTLGESIQIEEAASGGLWTALADRSQMENAIVNLAVNARDAMADGGKLTLEVGNAYLDEAYGRLYEDVRPGQYVMLAVTDTGTGMKPEVVSRAFDPFFSTKAEGRGTGLGLSMVYGFCKQSGGHAKIYSEVGVGTTIKLYLPRSTKHEVGPAAVASDASAGPASVSWWSRMMTTFGPR